MIELYFPQSCGEWLAWLVAWGFVFIGIFYFFWPKVAMRMFWTYPQQESASLLAAVRGNMGGIPLGIGIGYLLFAQPFLAVALFLAAFFALVGRLASFIIDKSFSGFNVIALSIEIVFSIASFVYAFGFVA
ncbi:protein of unknown function (DUF4345) [Bartonella apis]|uniref:AGROH133_08824 family phage infection protein n=1 Tax=Bartonella apis TaxID=1686310 RepID=UPI000965D674|nr:DUF4345 family protein [Bartonella apis]OLY46793.1 protein of unknown function (DUF4345) [Bartonella apis]